MANKKISALTGSTTPLAGTELVPIVQSSATVNVTVANLTASRAVATGTLSVTSSSAPAATFQYNAGAGNITKFQSSALSGYVMCDHSGNGNWYFDTASLANFGVKVNSSTIGLFSPAGFAVTGVGSFSETLSAKLTANPGGLPTTSGSSVSIVSLRVANANTGVGIDFGADGAATGDGWIQSRSPSDYTVNNPLRINPNGGLTSIGAGLTVTTGIVTMSAYGAGAATFSASGVISSVSDENWKRKDGVPSNPTEMLGKLQPGYWYYNDKYKNTFGVDRQLGFYAQNVNAAIGPEAAPPPESIKVTDDQGVETLQQKPWGYYDRSVLAVVVMAMQEALATVKALEIRIQKLEQRTTT